MNKQYEYDIAISFAEEDRNAALALALALELKEFQKVYYYPDNLDVTVGHELKERLRKIFYDEAKYAVVFLSENYFNSNKGFVPEELEVIVKRIKESEDVYMIPVVLNNYSIEMHSNFGTFGYLKWNYNPKEIANVLRKILGIDKTQIFDCKKLIGKEIMVENIQMYFNTKSVINYL
jgi:sulfatase modifying factor 1